MTTLEQEHRAPRRWARIPFGPWQAAVIAGVPLLYVLAKPLIRRVIDTDDLSTVSLVYGVGGLVVLCAFVAGFWPVVAFPLRTIRGAERLCPACFYPADGLAFEDGRATCPECGCAFRRAEARHALAHRLTIWLFRVLVTVVAAFNAWIVVTTLAKV